MDAIELALQIENTAAFIAAKPSSIVLIPKTEKTRTPAGGWTFADGDPRPAQTFRIIELGQKSTPPTIKVQDGTLREVAFWLLGTPDVVVAKNDHWTSVDGRAWTVADIIRSNEYEVRAIVVEDGA